MVRKVGVAHIVRQIAEQGLARLMMRLPATRATIRAAAASQPHLYELCGAYGGACAVLDRMRKDRSADPAIVTEYEIICAEIEIDVTRILLGGR
ncbi:nodulation protein [Rhizobium sp. RMa-01]|uniref:nodulation protein n=1 Tax=unclassified Rhizobium TaxID=2613769 RepID=UPI0008DB31D8|nr:MULTISPECIES: nodulation protein [unclassified Rhizobium]OHV25007.1 nodulation protein [Rhizobium sp. RSm-3]RVU08284.1 nodulation protein [Rhizobium sp. RMa-01]